MSSTEHSVAAVGAVPGVGIPRLIDDDGEVLDLVVYEDALVLSRFGLVGEVEAAPAKGLWGWIRRGHVQNQNARRLAILQALPAEQALMTESRNRLVPVRATDHAEVRPTRDGGTVTLHLDRSSPRSFSFASAGASIETVQDALRVAFSDRVTHRRPRAWTLLGAAFDLAVTVCLVGLAGYVVWSSFSS